PAHRHEALHRQRPPRPGARCPRRPRGATSVRAQQATVSQITVTLFLSRVTGLIARERVRDEGHEHFSVITETKTIDAKSSRDTFGILSCDVRAHRRDCSAG